MYRDQGHNHDPLIHPQDTNAQCWMCVYCNHKKDNNNTENPRFMLYSPSPINPHTSARFTTIPNAKYTYQPLPQSDPFLFLTFYCLTFGL
jgi:hypothetical protein